MRAVFMIPTKPPPSFTNPNKWSAEFIDFVSKCLVKNPKSRATATELLKHKFIQQSPNNLKNLLNELEILREINTKIELEQDKDYNLENTIKSKDNECLKYNETLKTSDNYQNNEDKTIKFFKSFEEKIENDYTLSYEEQTIVETMIIKKEQDIKITSNYIEDILPKNSLNSIESSNTHKLSHQLDIDTKFSVNKNDLEVVLDESDIKLRLHILDYEMAKEIDSLKNKYDLKRKPILEAIIAKNRNGIYF